MGIWESISTLVSEGKVIAHDAAILTKASIAAYHDYKSGASKTPLEALLKQSEQVLPIVQGVIGLLVPGAGTVTDLALSAFGFMITHAHKMTPEEEKRWFDHASQVTGL